VPRSKALRSGNSGGHNGNFEIRGIGKLPQLAIRRVCGRVRCIVSSLKPSSKRPAADDNLGSGEELDQLVANGRVIGAKAGERIPRNPVLGDEPKKQMLSADVVVDERLRFGNCSLERGDSRRRKRAAGLKRATRLRRDPPLYLALHIRSVDAYLFNSPARKTVGITQQT
jgi:hypothetical protein